MKTKSKIWKPKKISSFLLESHNFSETYFNKVEFTTETSGAVLNIEFKRKMVDLLP